MADPGNLGQQLKEGIYPLGYVPSQMVVDTLGVTEPSSWQSSFRPCPIPLPGSAAEKLCFVGTAH